MDKIRNLMVYGTLATLIIIQFARQPASESAQAAARSAADKTILGPADFIELIDENGEIVKLRAAKGRIAWSDHRSGRALSVAFVQVIEVIQKAMDTEEMRALAKSKTEEHDNRYREYAAKFEEFKKRTEGLGTSDPRYREIYAEYQALTKEYEAWTQSEKQETNRLHLVALTKGRADFQAAIEVVAKRMDIDVVLQSHSPTEKLDDDYSRATYDLQGQDVVHYPDAIDITTDVCKELGITLDAP